VGTEKSRLSIVVAEDIADETFSLMTRNWGVERVGKQLRRRIGQDISCLAGGIDYLRHS